MRLLVPSIHRCVLPPTIPACYPRGPPCSLVPELNAVYSNPPHPVLPQEAIQQRKRNVSQALAQGPRVHSRSRGCFVRTHADDAERSVYLANRFDKTELKAVAPPPVKADGKVGG